MGLAIIVPGVSFTGGNLGKVTLSGIIPVVSLSINNGVVVGPNAIDFTATLSPASATDKRVLWSITTGSEYATINSNGRLSVNSGASSSTVVIRATSVSSPSVYSEKTITVSYEDPGYDLYYSKEQLSGTALDMETFSDLHLHSDSNTSWTLFAYVPPMSQSPSSGNQYTMLAANNQTSSPYDGFSIFVARENYTGEVKQLYPALVTSSGSRSAIDLATGQVITQSQVPTMTQDGLSHAFAISRSGDEYKYSMDGETWNNFATYTPTENAKTAIVTIGGATVSGVQQRFPISTLPCEIALVLGESEHPFAELFGKYL